MEKSKALEALNDYRRQMTQTSIITDDGADDGDERQNGAFTASLKDIKAIRSKVAAIEVDGYSSEMLNELWRNSFGASFNSNAPEDNYTQTMTYIDLLIAELS